MADLDYNRRIGDRKDGRLLRSIEPFHKLAPFVMKTRNGASNYYSDSVEVTGIDNFIRRNRLNGYPGLGILHLLIAAYVRTVSQIPAINRYISGQRIYARHKIEIILSVRRSPASEESETMVKTEFLPTDTVFDVYRKLNDNISDIRSGNAANNMEQAAISLNKAPRFIIKIIMRALNFADYYDWLPQSLLNISPFHGSMAITDMGAIGALPLSQHLYDMGSLPLSLTYGAKRKSEEWDMSIGMFTERRYIDYAITIDARICDKFYYVSAFKLMKHLLSNPDQLEAPPESVEEDTL